MHLAKATLAALLGIYTAGCSAGSSASAPPGGGQGSASSVGSGDGGGSGFFAAGGDPGISVSPGPGSAGGSQQMSGPDASVVDSEQPESIDECAATNTAGLDAAGVKTLTSGSGGPGTLRLLNPYPGTVFPRGLIAPLLMWDGADGATADVVYLHLKSSLFEYRGCLKPTAPGQLQIPQTVWEHAAAHAHGPSDPYTLELTAETAGKAVGPVSEKLVIAQATLKGTIYYNSYASKLVSGGGGFGVGGPGGGTGAVLRIVPGKIAEVFLGQSGCIGCHSVSANGARMVADPILDLFNGGATFALTPGIAPNPPRLAATARGTAFTAVSPDGAVYLSSAHQGGLGVRGGSDPNATLYDTDTGAVITGTGIPTGAMTPMFSPDGSLLVFNDYAIAQGHGLATMTYDKTARTAAAYKSFLTISASGTYPAWPFFLPDNHAVLFTEGTTTDFSGANLGINGETGVVSSDVYIADVGTGAPKLLANAMGYATDADATAGKTYLPFGAEELHHNFYPTGSPVAAGGYFWVFFDSYRHYGNTHSKGMVRQLWGTAVDVSSNGTYSVDPSHPPFYLTGQEDVEGNHRAFTALDPCLQDGSSCATGIECCVGFCTNGKCGKPPPPVMGPACSKTDESCAGGATCCSTSDKCINGFCGQVFH